MVLEDGVAAGEISPLKSVPPPGMMDELVLPRLLNQLSAVVASTASPLILLR